MAGIFNQQEYCASPGSKATGRLRRITSTSGEAGLGGGCKRRTHQPRREGQPGRTGLHPSPCTESARPYLSWRVLWLWLLLRLPFCSCRGRVSSCGRGLCRPLRRRRRCPSRRIRVGRGYTDTSDTPCTQSGDCSHDQIPHHSGAPGASPAAAGGSLGLSALAPSLPFSPAPSFFSALPSPSFPSPSSPSSPSFFTSSSSTSLSSSSVWYSCRCGPLIGLDERENQGCSQSSAPSGEPNVSTPSKSALHLPPLPVIHHV